MHASGYDNGKVWLLNNVFYLTNPQKTIFATNIALALKQFISDISVLIGCRAKFTSPAKVVIACSRTVRFAESIS